MSRVFQNLVTPIVEKYFSFSFIDVRENGDFLRYYDLVLEQDLGPFPEGYTEFNDLKLKANQDNTVDISVSVDEFVQPRIKGKLADYLETNPILLTLFPDELKYRRLTLEEYEELEDTGTPQIEVDLRSYLQIRLFAEVEREKLI